MTDVPISGAGGDALRRLGGMSQADYARLRGVTRQAIHDAINRGRITPLADGTIDPVAANLVLDGEIYRLGEPRADEPRADEPRADEARIDDPSPATAASAGLTKARTESEEWQGVLRKLAAEERSGRLIQVEELKAAGTLIAVTLAREIELLTAATFVDDLFAATTRGGRDGLAAELLGKRDELLRSVATKMASFMSGRVEATQ